MQCTVGRAQDQVTLSHAGQSAGLPYGAADALYFAIKRHYQQAEQYDKTSQDPAALPSDQVGPLRVHRLGLMIVLERAGRLWIEAPYQTMWRIAQALYTKAREVEEDVVKIANGLIVDQALLFRMGIKLGLTEDSRKIYEAKRLAAGVAPDGVVGTPRVNRLTRSDQ
jgi:hypothetical protein